ncbi:MAG TPA: YfhO family protein, partial [Blastocatellia bacterium]|nr:YfhO family protein [Blastocatellia bacterium]
PSERWRQLGRFNEVEVYENLRVMPRVWLSPVAATKPPEEILKTIRNNPDRVAGIFTALTEENVPLVQNTDFLQHTLEIKSYTPHRIDVAVDGINNGLLVLSEIFYDGWEARVDGEPTKIYRTDYTLRGVVVPAGNHRVEFVYRPRSFRLGAIGFMFGVAVLLLGGLFVRRARL